MNTAFDRQSHHSAPPNGVHWRHTLFSSAVLGRLSCFFLIAAFLMALTARSSQVFFSPSGGWPDLWLTPTFYLWNGYDIYGANGEPSLVILYGPVMYLAYTPALLGATPLIAIWIASSLAAVYGMISLLAPLWVLARHSFFPNKTLAWGAAAVLVVIAVIETSLPNLFTIHPENPAIVALVLAALAVAFPFRGSLWVAAGLCLVAGSAKFVYLTAIGGIFCYLYQVEGRKRAFKFVVCSVAAGMVALALIHWKFGLAEVYEATIRNASTHPFVWHRQLNDIKIVDNSSLLFKLACAARIFQLLMLRLLPSLFLIILLWMSTPNKPSPATPSSRWALLCGWLALALLPTGVLGFAKFGGDFNTVAPVTLFLIQIALVLGVNWYRHYGQAKIVQGAMIITFAVSCSYLMVQSAIHFYRADLTLYPRLQKLLEKYPDEVWLPAHPLAHWFFQKKMIHSGDVISCHLLGGTELPPSWLAAGWPKKMAFVIRYHYDPDIFVKNNAKLMKNFGNVMAEEKDPRDFGLPDDGSYIVLGAPSVEESRTPTKTE